MLCNTRFVYNEGLVTDYTVFFAGYAKFNRVLNQLKQIYINQVNRALKISYDCLLSYY